MSVLIGLGLLGGIAAACGTFGASDELPQTPSSTGLPAKGETLVVGGGCFWCIEPLFHMVKGVTDVEVGYAGGTIPKPTYEQVCTGTTGHAEAVKITFDPKQISAHDLLTLFFTMHDPTTKDRQGPDAGPQYRSVVFYKDSVEKELAEKVIAEIENAKIWPARIVTTLEPLRNYSTAEEYHQDYYAKYASAPLSKRMSMNVSYCRVVIEPKVHKFREKFKHLLRG
ncbi:MAG: peptide-methionine (S)-S-oxide reductase MsrA [Fimbriimonas sp.]